MLTLVVRRVGLHLLLGELLLLHLLLLRPSRRLLLLLLPLLADAVPPLLQPLGFALHVLAPAAVRDHPTLWEEAGEDLPCLQKSGGPKRAAPTNHDEGGSRPTGGWFLISSRMLISDSKLKLKIM